MRRGIGRTQRMLDAVVESGRPTAFVVAHTEAYANDLFSRFREVLDGLGYPAQANAAIREVQWLDDDASSGVCKRARFVSEAHLSGPHWSGYDIKGSVFFDYSVVDRYDYLKCHSIEARTLLNRFKGGQE